MYPYVIGRYGLSCYTAIAYHLNLHSTYYFFSSHSINSTTVPAMKVRDTEDH